MAFLDNSGDIILDAVLTDTGRYRLAKGDGSFKITRFALGDDEIDYSLYNKDNPSGSAYYDLDILQTPILEALTDNATAVKSHLISIEQTDLLFLPIIRLFKSNASQTFDSKDYFIVCSDVQTEKRFSEIFAADGATQGIPGGVFYTQGRSSTQANNIIVHQGWDTPKISPLQNLPPDLVETVYMVEMDNRLGSLLNPEASNQVLEISYVDDDQIASYLLSRQKNRDIVKPIITQNAEESAIVSSIRGPRGTSLTLKLAASLELQTNTYLFEELGSTVNIAGTAGSDDFLFIDTNLRISGANTGYRIDIPIRFIKLA